MSAAARTARSRVEGIAVGRCGRRGRDAVTRGDRPRVALGECATSAGAVCGWSHRPSRRWMAAMRPVPELLAGKPASDWRSLQIPASDRDQADRHEASRQAWRGAARRRMPAGDRRCATSWGLGPDAVPGRAGPGTASRAPTPLGTGRPQCWRGSSPAGQAKESVRCDQPGVPSQAKASRLDATERVPGLTRRPAKDLRGNVGFCAIRRQRSAGPRYRRPPGPSLWRRTPRCCRRGHCCAGPRRAAPASTPPPRPAP